ncbi:MAG: hypothetical protein INR71_06810, partial [Terriglobus roseus]|nr:hypothetical protein [Terriglobus roseus]
MADHPSQSTSDLRVSHVPFPTSPPGPSTTVLIRPTHVSVSHVDLLYFQG